MANGTGGAGKLGRNEPCPCGSGRKFKQCCGRSTAGRAPEPSSRPAVAPRQLRAALERGTRGLAAGDLTAAIQAFQHAAMLDPESPLPRLELGKALLAAARPREALPWIEQALRLNEHSAAAKILRGTALEQLGWLTEAADAYREAIAQAPRQAEAHARLGAVLMMQELRIEAAASFHKAAQLAPKTGLGRLCEAYGLMAAGRAELAQAALRHVVALEQGNAPAYAELGKLLAEAGDADSAWKAFEQAVRLDPRAAGNFYDLVRIRKLSAADRPLLQEMLQVAQRPDLPDLHRIMLEIAIGKACDDLDLPQQAMDHYLESARLKARIRPLDRAMIAQRVAWATKKVTRDYLAAIAASGSPAATPILILGMPRSGTTLVESILAAHSRVAAGQELPYWGRRAREFVDGDRVPSGSELAALAGGYLETLRAIAEAPHVTDKKPDNFFYAGLIHAAFPRARIIHCRRHPVDTCLSILGNFFAPRPDFSSEPEDLAHYYREYEQVMSHWRAVLPADRFLEVDYEALTGDPEPVISQLIAFCGLPWEDACLRPESNRRRINTASLWQARRPIFTASVGRWRRFSPWLGPLGELAGLRPV